MPTIRELAREGTNRLSRLPNPDLDAKILLLHAAAVSEETFLAHPENVLSRGVAKRYRKLVARRGRGIPLFYLIGTREFWSLPFRVAPGVLIPRPETELVVESVLALSSRGEELLIDIGTGSGNIALTLAKELPRARIIATDVSRRALRIARGNGRRLGISNIAFVRGDLFEPLAELRLEGSCDFIVSNPPYVSQADWERLPSEIKDHEPKEALLAGSDGLRVIERLVSESAAYLRPGGRLVVEVGSGQSERVRDFFGREWDRVSAAPDLAGLPRVVTARKA